ncbi:MAG: ACT domain-containing protein [Ruminococcaceae bacterium]|nr:ACT domain-containing protein [Oscillospiraceae bacterium]
MVPSTENKQYLVIDKAALPEIYDKILYVTRLVENGEASSTSEAVKMAGISRSVYYKYKDMIFPYQRERGGIITMQVVLCDKPGVLMNLLSVFYEENANILTLNQNIPVKGKAFVSISAREGSGSLNADKLIKRIKELDGVVKIDSIAE